MLDKIYGLYEIDYDDIHIEIYVGAADGSITIYVNDEYFLMRKNSP